LMLSASSFLYTLSLHDALPISILRKLNDRSFTIWAISAVLAHSFKFTFQVQRIYFFYFYAKNGFNGIFDLCFIRFWTYFKRIFRSEEHTSELQSRFDLVCRLLL